MRNYDRHAGYAACPDIGSFGKGDGTRPSTMRASALPDLSDLPNIMSAAFEIPLMAELKAEAVAHAPRILLLYGSLRERSYRRFLALEAARLLATFGAETRGCMARRETPRGIRQIW